MNFGLPQSKNIQGQSQFAKGNRPKQHFPSDSILVRALSIQRQPDSSLTITWDDQHVSNFSMQLFRDECPCANCKGETILGKVYRPITLNIFTPGKYELTKLEPTGQYGVQAWWKDGHDTGIYSWDYLRRICPCEECSAKRVKSD